MANNERLGASFSIDTTNLKAGLQEANRLIRASESEFREAAAGMDDWTESEEGLTKRQKTLNTQIDIQKQKISALTAEKQKIIEKMKAEGKSQEEIDKAIDSTNKQITQESKQLDRLRGELDKTDKSLDDVTKGTKEAGDGFAGLKKAGGIAAGAVAAVGAACVAAVGAFLGLAESTKETQTAMAKLDTAFQTAFGDADVAAENATTTMYDLYGVLGDMDRSVEASVLLAKMSKDEDDLQRNTRILTGVFAEFGDSIPTEGLAEGMQATAEMGSVQGVLADALEWQGVNLDDYNAKLQSMTSAEERAAYIQETLTDLYGASADAYRENNEALIENNEAQLRMEQSLADIGKVALPIVTELKNAVSSLLTEITPFVELIGEGLTGAFDGAADAEQKLADGLSGVLTTALDKVVEMIPTVLNVVTAMIPAVLSAISEAIPQILDAVVSVIPDVVQMLLDAIPLLITSLSEIIVQVLNALGELLPQIVEKVIEILPTIIQSFMDAIPQLLQAAIQFLMAIVQAIPVLIDKLLSELPGIIQTILDGILNALPELLAAAIQLFNAIIQAIPVIIQSLVENLPTIINTIIDGLLDALPLLLDAAIQLLMAIIQAIPTILSILIRDIPNIVTTIISALLSRLPELINGAVKLLMGIVAAIPTIIKELVKQTPQIIKTIVASLSDGIGNVAEVGKNIIKGLWNGISDMVGWIGEKIKGFGETVLGGIKSFFGIKSPSKVMADQVGKNLALGIGEGFEKNIAGVNKEITDAMTFDDASVNVNATGGARGGGVTVYQTNNYKQAYTSPIEKYKSKQQLYAAARLIKAGAV